MTKTASAQNEGKRSRSIDKELSVSRRNDENKVKFFLITTTTNDSRAQDTLFQQLDVLYGTTTTATGSMKITSFLLDELVEVEIHAYQGRSDFSNPNVVRRWMPCLDSMNAILFVANLSTYDEYTTGGENKLVKAMEIVRTVCSRIPAGVSTTLFLHKEETFASKIRESNIADQRPFCDYTGPTKSFRYGVQYLIQRFQECGLRENHSHALVCLTRVSGGGRSINDIDKFIRNSTRTISMKDGLARAGFLEDCGTRECSLDSSFRTRQEESAAWGGAVPEEIVVTVATPAHRR